MTTKYYVDTNGVYIGAFDGAHGVDISTYIEVPEAPVNANYTWDGTAFICPLATAKATKIGTVDARTGQLIGVGFTFDNTQFSLSANAQINWVGMKTLESLITWPLNITTITDGEYSLSQANLNSFVGTAKGSVQAHLDSGRALKVQINACTTLAAVAAITDTR